MMKAARGDGRKRPDTARHSHAEDAETRRTVGKLRAPMQSRSSDPDPSFFFYLKQQSAYELLLGLECSRFLSRPRPPREIKPLSFLRCPPLTRLPLRETP